MWAADQGHTDVAKLLLDRGSVATVGDKVQLSLFAGPVLYSKFFYDIMTVRVYSTSNSQSKWPHGCCEGVSGT